MRRPKRVPSNRDRGLRRVLESERDRVLDAIRLTIQAGREEGAIEDAEVQDRAEVSEADARGDLEFALLQMHGETLQQVEDALERLDAGSYGMCLDCGAAISTRRLEALPFAMRCRKCEQDHEAQPRHLPPPTATWRKTAQLFG
jgi:DnaK suppressor protein